MGPLDGIRVLDFTQAMAGPDCSMLLADFGAEVVKVEPPGGDGSRSWGTSRFGPDQQFSALYLAFNRNKASVELDLKSDAGQAAASELIAGSDVVIEGFKPGVADRLGIGYDQVAALPAGRRLLQHLRLRPDRAAPGAPGLRPAAPGLRRAHEHHRRAWPARRCGSARRRSTC